MRLTSGGVSGQERPTEHWDAPQRRNSGGQWTAAAAITFALAGALGLLGAWAWNDGDPGITPIASPLLASLSALASLVAYRRNPDSLRRRLLSILLLAASVTVVAIWTLVFWELSKGVR